MVLIVNNEMFKFKIGKVYIGKRESDWFEYVVVEASDERNALNTAVNYLKPNHLQTLAVIEKLI